MSRRSLVAGLVLAACAHASTAWAQGLFFAFGDPQPLVVSTATAGAQPDAVTSGTTSYTLINVSLLQTVRVRARLNAPLPPGVTLEVTLTAPPGATSLGPVALTTTDRDVVVGVRPLTVYLTGTITYRLSATVAAGVVGPLTRQVIFTVVSP